jgi:hypothetical protein
MDSLLADLPKIASVFALAFFSFWPAIPAGLALGLSPLVVIVTTTLSYTLGVALVALFGGRVRDWVMQRLNRSSTAHSDSRLRRIWDRFGVAGLGLAAPMTVGAQIGAALGLLLNAPATIICGDVAGRAGVECGADRCGIVGRVRCTSGCLGVSLRETID